MSDPVSLAAVREAADLIASRVRRTPLLEVPASVHRRVGVRLLLKLECEQVSGAFKARGARHFVARQIAAGQDISGVVTYSSGNHGRAVAEAAAAFEIPALVTVPDHVDASKERAIVRAGAEALRAGPTSESRETVARAIAEERGWVIVPPFDHEWIIAGQGTSALEILDEVDEAPVGLWAPVGGGGLSAGCAAVLRGAAPEVTLHTVEPEGSACFAAAAKAGRIVRIERSDSIADGLLPLTVGALNYETLVASKFDAHTVQEETIIASFRTLRTELSVECETSGAVAVAPILADPDTVVPPGLHVAIVSGGNIAEERLVKLLG